MPNPKGDSAVLSLLEQMREARVAFFRELCAASSSEDLDVQLALRQDSSYQLAEFFYLIQAYGIDSAAAIQELANSHNAYLNELVADREKMLRMGLRPDRVEKALFRQDHLGKLVENYRRTPPAIDQSDLSRLLAIVMSSETCRKLCVACEAAGFLIREKSAYGSVLVRSAGHLERIYGEHLARLYENIASKVYGGRQ